MATKEQLRLQIRKLEAALESPIHEGKEVTVFWASYSWDRENGLVGTDNTNYYFRLSKCQDQVKDSKSFKLHSHRVVQVEDDYYEPNDYELKSPLKVIK